MGGWQLLLYYRRFFFSFQTHKQVRKLQFYGVEICLKKDCIFVSMENPEFQLWPTSNFSLRFQCSRKGEGYGNLLTGNYLIHALFKATL